MVVPPRRLLAGLTATVFVLGLAIAVSSAVTANAGSDTTTHVAPRLHGGYPEYAQAASACPGLDPVLLVAIHDVETGRDAQGETSSAGAMGPRQFLPDTWAAYGVDANQDGTADPLDLADALAGATNLLCANGVTANETYQSAIWNYNHSWTYVRMVLARAAELHRIVRI